MREGRVVDVIDEGMHELGLTEVMEKYVFVAVPFLLIHYYMLGRVWIRL